MKTVPEIYHALPTHVVVNQKDMEAETAMSFEKCAVNAGEWEVLPKYHRYA